MNDDDDNNKPAATLKFHTSAISDGDNGILNFTARSADLRRQREQMRRNEGRPVKTQRLRDEDEPATLASPFVTEEDMARKEFAAQVVDTIRDTHHWSGLIAEAVRINPMKPALAIDQAAGRLKDLNMDVLNLPPERVAKGVSLMLGRMLQEKKRRDAGQEDDLSPRR